MIPRRIEIENFLSFGTPAVELCFDDDSLWVLSGPNGVGKSDVFDAITYALFGEHRGGTQKAEKLVRHGANGFRLVFEFEFDGAAYRVTRTRGGRTTQKVECRTREGDWAAIDLPGGHNAVKAWAERTLGLGFETFTASVLLRQGQADAIITAGGKDRLALLKRITAVERFERLSHRVHEATKRHKDRLEDLQTRRTGLAFLSEEELSEARRRFSGAEAARANAHGRAGAAAARVPLAERWAECSSKRASLEGLVRAADARVDDAARIRGDAARLEELTALVPTLRTLAQLRQALQAGRSAVGRLRSDRERLTAERDAHLRGADAGRQRGGSHGRSAEGHEREAGRLRGEIERETKHVDVAEEVAKLREQLSILPAGLDEQNAAALRAAESARGEERSRGEAKAVAEGLLRQAAERRREFGRVGVGVACSLCGQVVTEDHAERERGRLADEVRALTDRVRRSEEAFRKAVSARADREATLTAVGDRLRQRDALTNRLAAKSPTLADLGVSAEAALLRENLAAKAGELKRRDREAVAERGQQAAAAGEEARLSVLGRGLTDDLAGLGERLLQEERSLERATGQRETEVGRLPAPWQDRVEGLTQEVVAEAEQERVRLAASGVEEARRQLDQDAALREEWGRQLGEVKAAEAGIPAEARLPLAEAHHAAEEATAAAGTADRERDAAKEALDGLARRFDEQRGLVEQIRVTERQHRLHKKLDDLLGNARLQRELVRQAEREIVRLANDTVQQLSDGELTLDLEQESDDDKALSLRVRRLDDPTPIEVSYLSGSQKFRVAVAVALAIGRFAAGQARPIESVIIDEGFGCLDREGLRAAADELNRLKRHLRRIILVSHQEEFAERFADGYRLSPGENGTTAERFRR